MVHQTDSHDKLNIHCIKCLLSYLHYFLFFVFKHYTTNAWSSFFPIYWNTKTPGQKTSD